jgi:hypothetical protein
MFLYNYVQHPNAQDGKILPEKMIAKSGFKQASVLCREAQATVGAIIRKAIVLFETTRQYQPFPKLFCFAEKRRRPWVQLTSNAVAS